MVTDQNAGTSGDTGHGDEGAITWKAFLETAPPGDERRVTEFLKSQSFRRSAESGPWYAFTSITVYCGDSDCDKDMAFDPPFHDVPYLFDPRTGQAAAAV